MRKAERPAGIALRGLVLIRDLVERTEQTVAERVEAATRTAGYLTEAAQVMNLAAAALASELRDSDAPLLPWLQDPDLRNDAGSEWTQAWTALRTAAVTEYKFTVERIRAAATLSQGGRGAPTAIDPSAFDERTLVNDPGGLRRRFRDADLGARHSRLKDLAEQAIEAEAAAAKTILTGIAELVGSEESLPLKNIIDAVSEAIATARSGHLLRSAGHEQDLEMIQLPSSRKANDARAGGWAAVRAAERGLSLEAVQRLAQLDRATLGTVSSYLTLAEQHPDRLQPGGTRRACAARRWQRHRARRHRPPSHQGVVRVVRGVRMILDEAATLKLLVAQASEAADDVNRDAALATVEERVSLAQRQLSMYAIARPPWRDRLPEPARDAVLAALSALASQLEPLASAADDVLVAYGARTVADERGGLAAIVNRKDELLEALQTAQEAMLGAWVQQLWPAGRRADLEVLAHLPESQTGR